MQRPRARKPASDISAGALASDNMAFIQEPFIDFGRGVSRYAEKGRGFPGGRQFGARRQAPIQYGRLQLAIQGPGGLARTLTRGQEQFRTTDPSGSFAAIESGPGIFPLSGSSESERLIAPLAERQFSPVDYPVPHFGRGRRERCQLSQDICP